MNSRQLGFTALLFGLGALSVSTACGEQPKPYCQTGRGEFAARFTVVSGPPECAARKGDLFGLQSYNEPLPSGAPNVARTPIAIQSVTLREHADRVESEAPVYAEGIFKQPQPDDNDLCAVDMKGPVEVDLAAAEEVAADAEEHTPLQRALPARKVRYEWNNLVFYVTAAATGTQFSANLKLTDSSFANGATCEYNVHAMFPSVSCGDPVKDDPTGRNVTRKDKQCTPDADPDLDHGFPTGAQINPDFPVACTEIDDVTVQGSFPTTLVCLPPAGKFPALK